MSLKDKILWKYFKVIIGSIWQYKNSVLIAVDFYLNTVKYLTCISTIILTQNLLLIISIIQLPLLYNLINRFYKILNLLHKMQNLFFNQDLLKTRQFLNFSSIKINQFKLQTIDLLLISNPVALAIQLSIRMDHQNLLIHLF